MEQQLTLVQTGDGDAAQTPEPAWALDQRTRDIGRRGLELARQALRGAGRQAA
ncbi:MAG: hypothetical protein ACR2HY_01795 [Acidimicrobiales bacterium]